MSREKILQSIELATTYLNDGAEHSAHRNLSEAINTLEQHYGITANTPNQTGSTSAPVMNYDPNMVTSGRKAKQVVRMTFGQWEYRATFEKTVGGNGRGLSVIDCAVGQVSDDLYSDEREYGSITMLNANGDELICDDDDDMGEDWLKNMLISAEIVSITPDGHF